ncbi:universal stress protein [Yoonia sp. SS1-5]|uniref:Universal stress protein n=1 Tax=Yoonia rhodophyticola TaxID=3137370 RepID=A0AAN0MCX0_9RHOB
MFSKVLVPVDVSLTDETQRQLQAAKTLTAPWNSDLHVVTVVPNVGMAIVGSYFDDDFEAKSKSAVQVALDEAVNAAGLSANTYALTGTVYDKVIDLADKLAIDLILIGAHQPALRDYLLGSNAARVVRHAKTSVLVLRN